MSMSQLDANPVLLPPPDALQSCHEHFVSHTQQQLSELREEATRALSGVRRESSGAAIEALTMPSAALSAAGGAATILVAAAGGVNGGGTDANGAAVSQPRLPPLVSILVSPPSLN
eukprot:54426-Chlamydomonas_euryale.AAC.4